MAARCEVWVFKKKGIDWPAYGVFGRFMMSLSPAVKNTITSPNGQSYGVFCIVGESLPSIFPISIPFRVG
jgi:hypothetical protein